MIEWLGYSKSDGFFSRDKASSLFGISHINFNELLLQTSSPIIPKFHLSFNNIPAACRKKYQKSQALRSRIRFFQLFWYTPIVGNWHLIGFAKNGIERILYVDDIEVDSDSVENLESASLYIGTDNSMELGTYWSSLIDDVLIYNRVVIP
jgi:hypothetical protein